MDAITHSEQSIFHIDTIAPSETQSPPVTLSLSSSHIQQWEIQRPTLTTVIPCWDLGFLGCTWGVKAKAQGGLRKEGRGKEELCWSLKSK